MPRTKTLSYSGSGGASRGASGHGEVDRDGNPVRDNTVSGEATVKRPYKDGRACSMVNIEAATVSGDYEFLAYCESGVTGYDKEDQRPSATMEVVFSGENCYAECQKIGQSRHSQCQQLNQEFVKAMNSAGCSNTRCDLEDSRMVCDNY